MWAITCVCSRADLSKMKGSGLRVRGPRGAGGVQDVGIAAFEMRMRGSGAPNAGIGPGAPSNPSRILAEVLPKYCRTFQIRGGVRVGGGDPKYGKGT